MSSDSAIIVDPPPSLDCLDVPPLDPLFFSFSSNTFSPSDDPVKNPNFVPDSNLDLDFNLEYLLDENADFELAFDSLDDLYLPSETESFLIPHNTPYSSASSEDRSPDRVQSDCAMPLEGNKNDASGGSPDRENSPGMASSQGSGGDGGGSGLSEDMNLSLPSLENPDRDRDVSSEFFPEQKIKIEVKGKNYDNIGDGNIMKRKKDQEDVSVETRRPKARKSTSKGEDNVSSGGNIEELKDEENNKRKARLMRNRESALLSRQRKKHYVEEMEEKLRVMQTTITDLNGKISFMMAENMSLRQQLSSATTGGMSLGPPAMALPPPAMALPPPGMYPHLAMPYPWVPCAPYVVKPQGSQVPLVPIPRLKPQQLVTTKVKKENIKKVESKSTRKVASISLLGILFFMLMFGIMVPKVNVRYSGVGGVPGQTGLFGERYHHEQYHRGKILIVNEHSNVSYHSNTVGKCRGCGSDTKEQPLPHRNGSEPLVASLYVPRNNKLVKIDGNLIIHSVLASEKAMASQTSHKKEDETMKQNLASALAIRDSTMIRGTAHAYRKPTESQMALGHGSQEMMNDHVKATLAPDGKLQQWFSEGLAGPLLSSGMCTEVFQFDVSPASAGAAIIPAPPASNNTSLKRHNVTSDHHTGKNRRILGRIPNRLMGSGTNITDREARGSMKGEDLPANKSLSSSMVVSVLVDPREAGDGDIDGVIRPKSISRIFVVVLMDSIKYVTYSCVLPRSGTSTHFVTA